MKTLSETECDGVFGGLSDSEANQVIGRAVGEAWHGLTSVEGRIGSIFGLGGMIAGVAIHYQLHH